MVDLINKVINALYLDYPLSSQKKVSEFFALQAPHINITNIKTEEELFEILDKKNDFGILLIELNLPNATVLKLIKKIKSHEIDIPIILITVMGKEEFALDALKIGASDYIIKSENYPSQLQNLIETYSVGYKFEQKYLIEQEKEFELQKSQKILRDLAENAGIVFWIKEIDSKKITYVSPSYETLSGRNCESFYSDVDSWHELIHPEDLKVFMDKLSNRVESKSEFIHRIITLDGKIKWVKTESYPLKDKRGKTTRILGTVQDITQFKEAELSIIKMSKRMNFLISENPVIISTCTVTGDFGTTFISENVYRILGYKPSEFIDNPSFWMEKTHPEDINIILSDLPAIFVKEFYTYESRILHANGSYRWILNELKLVKNKDGEAVEVIVSMIDITEQKQSEEKLREQAALLDITTDAIIVRDMDNNIIYWNRGAEKLYGLKKEEVLGKNIIKSIYDSPKGAPDSGGRIKTTNLEFEQAMVDVLKNGKWQGELQQINVNKEELIVDSKWNLMTDKDGKPVSIMVVNTDISKRKLMETEHLRVQRLDSIGTLVTGIAHDLNNVLAPMMLSTEILKMRFSDEKGLKLVESMEKSARHGADLVKQLLIFARGVEGKHSTLQLNTIIEEVKQIISGTFPLNINIISEIAEDLKNISGESTQLNQVIMNLLVNARDAMPESGIIRISAKNIYLDSTFVQMKPEARTGHYVMLSVSDTGCGIPKGIIDKIFEPFFTTKGIGKGTGLGLSTTIGIIKSHGGFINVRSKEGKGTEFKIYLPVSEDKKDISVTNNFAENYRGNGETILIIEDEDAIVEAATQTLEQFNYNVLKASDGVEGISIYLQNKDKISLVITDIMLPLMDGHQTIKAILKLNPAEKFIVTSGHEQPENIKQIGEQIKFISKPFTANTLLIALHEHLYS